MTQSEVQWKYHNASVSCLLSSELTSNWRSDKRNRMQLSELEILLLLHYQRCSLFLLWNFHPRRIETRNGQRVSIWNKPVATTINLHRNNRWSVDPCRAQSLAFETSPEINWEANHWPIPFDVRLFVLSTRTDYLAWPCHRSPAVAVQENYLKWHEAGQDCFTGWGYPTGFGLARSILFRREKPLKRSKSFV